MKWEGVKKDRWKIQRVFANGSQMDCKWVEWKEMGLKAQGEKDSFVVERRDWDWGQNTVIHDL